MKVIFLDIDGVLNVISQGRDEYGSLFHPEFENNLHDLIEATGAKIVISSTWRKSGLSIMREMWERRGLPGEVYDITPNTPYIRGEEIAEWLRGNPVDAYVIIDDDDDMLDDQLPYFVRTSGNKNHPDKIDIGFGLTKICTTKAIEILNNNGRDEQS